MRIGALLVAVLLATPGGVAAQSGDIFEVTFTQHGLPGAPQGVIHLKADELEVLQCCMITLRQGPDIVATFQSHQISLVVNLSAGGERDYELFQHTGEPLHLRADRMVPDQNGLVHFYSDGRLVGVTNQNSAQMVIDVGARVDSDGQAVAPRVWRER